MNAMKYVAISHSPISRVLFFPFVGYQSTYLHYKTCAFIDFTVPNCLESMSQRNFGVAYLNFTEIKHCNWLKLVTWLPAANQSALFQCSIAMLILIFLITMTSFAATLLNVPTTCHSYPTMCLTIYLGTLLGKLSN